MTALEPTLEALFGQVLKSKMGEPLPFYGPAEEHAGLPCAEDAARFSSLDLERM